ncbi:MAG: hypothetical protein ACI8ZM_002060 [Crocinitomix sp.]|jgi:hypothetical protein
MKKDKKINWRKSGFEFLSIFIAVISAFALNNWNENRKADNSEESILIEIANGLEKDIEDMELNMEGHRIGISACNFFRNLFLDKQINTDTLVFHYFEVTRDYISVQNVAGYEALKSQGLGLIKVDSLRLQIISLYEYDYNILRKFEEEYSEMQFNDNYFEAFNEVLAPKFQLDSNGNIRGIDFPLAIPADQRQILIMNLWKIETNRNFILHMYSGVLEKAKHTLEIIRAELA